jgi:hypothetical protein
MIVEYEWNLEDSETGGALEHPCNFKMCSSTSSYDSFFSLQIVYQYFVIYFQFIFLKLTLLITSRHQNTIYYIL